MHALKTKEYKMHIAINARDERCGVHKKNATV